MSDELLECQVCHGEFDREREIENETRRANRMRPDREEARLQLIEQYEDEKDPRTCFSCYLEVKEAELEGLESAKDSMFPNDDPDDD